MTEQERERALRSAGVAGVLLGAALVVSALAAPGTVDVVIEVDGVLLPPSPAFLLVDVVALSNVAMPADPTATRPALSIPSAVADPTTPVPAGMGRLQVELRCVDPAVLAAVACPVGVRLSLQAYGDDVSATAMSLGANGTFWADCPPGTWLLAAGGVVDAPLPATPATTILPPTGVLALDVRPNRIQGLRVIAAIG